MSRRISSLFSFFTAHFSFLLLHLLAELSEAESSGSGYLGYGDSLRIIKTEDLDWEFQGYDTFMKNKYEKEKWLADKGYVINPKSPETDSSVMRDMYSDTIIQEREKKHVYFEKVTDNLHKKYNLSRDHMHTLPDMTMGSQMGQKMRDSCMQMVTPVQCDAYSKYRTADGSCNNLQNPALGSAMSCQQRLYYANYVGSSGIRQQKKGGDLPWPRILSLKLHFPLNRPSHKWTQLYVFYGQALDHDMAFTPSSTTVNNQAIQCCPPRKDNHPQCQPIKIPDNDSFYSKYGMTCMNFVRSAPCPSCKLGPRIQMDTVTSYIDASFVYGNSENKTKSLRTNDESGCMRVEKSDYGDVLPRDPNPENPCNIPKENKYCFASGDTRVNQHSSLCSLHTLFVRLHNRCADKLRYINPHWDGETVFQECRRIVGAHMQVITYKEYLPITLGPQAMTKYGLWAGYRTEYNDNLNPSMMVEFTTAAFRFGHSLINSVVSNCPPNSTNKQLVLKNDFLRTYSLRHKSIGHLLKGTSEIESQSFDQWKVEDVTNYLYRLPKEKKGLDLAAININRGRDHGLPTYPEMVKYCSDGKIVIKCFRDLYKYKLMEKEQADDLRGSYSDVYDIDLWTGIVMEKAYDGGVVGFTATCIIGKQFHNLKYGDRFYFEHRYQTGSFSEAQLAELWKVSLAQIICLNTDVSSINENVFLYGASNNPKIRCCDVEDIDYWKWKDYY